jgi:hypothetical protein
MDTQFWIQFFFWCTIINVGLLFFIAFWQMVAPGLLFKTQSLFFPMERDKFNYVFYFFMGIFKVLVIVFNLVPLIVLLIIAQ